MVVVVMMTAANDNNHARFPFQERAYSYWCASHTKQTAAAGTATKWMDDENKNIQNDVCKHLYMCAMHT